MQRVFWCCWLAALWMPLLCGHTAASEADSDLLGKLNSPDPAIAREAIRALARAGPDAAPAVPALLRAMGRHDSALDNDISTTIAKIGAPPKQAVPELVRLMRDDRGLVRHLAAGALRKIGPVDREIVSGFLPGLQSPDARRRERAVEALGLLRAPHEIAIPALIRAMDDADALVRLAAALAAGRILPPWQVEPGPGLQKLLPALVGATKDPDPNVRRRAATSLGERGAAARAAVPALVELLEKEELTWLQGYVADALGHFGPAAAPAVPALSKALRSADAGLRGHAVCALGRIQREKAVPMLVEMLQDPHVNVRRLAVNSLGQQGPAAAPALESLVPLTDDPNQDLRKEATELLERIRGILAREASEPASESGGRR